MYFLTKTSLKIKFIIDYKNIMNPERLDIIQLIENNPVEKLSNYYQTRLLDKIKGTFDDSDQKIFVASFYCYLQYDSKTDFVIDMDDVWKWLGFSRKDHFKRVIEKHFIKDIDYKIMLPNSGERKNEGGHNKEKILMNIETFKSSCLLANTERSKTVRKYYYKLEQLLHELLEEQANELKQEIEEQKQLAQKQEQKLIEQQQKINILEHKPNTHGFNSRRAGYVYMINDRSKPGHYKIGMSYDVDKRLSKLNVASSEASLQIYHEVKTYDCETLENTVHKILQPFNILRRREWFFFSNDNELQYALRILHETQMFLNKFNLESFDDVIKYVTNNANNNIQPKQQLDKVPKQQLDKVPKQQLDKVPKQQLDKVPKQQLDKVPKQLDEIPKQQLDKVLKQQLNKIPKQQLDKVLKQQLNKVSKQQLDKVSKQLDEIQETFEQTNQDFTETNIYKLTGQQLKNKTGNYKGVFWCTGKSKWRAALKIHYKEYFLGYFDTELDGAIVYNDYALFLNNTRKTSYTINDIPEYTPNPRDILEENLQKQMEMCSSKYIGVSYYSKRKFYVVSIKYQNKTYHLGNNVDETECAKLYNQQALYFNNTFSTNYILNDIPNYITTPKNIHGEILENKINKKSSKYYGVTVSKSNKFKALLVYNKKQIHLGTFTNELDAAKVYNTKAQQLNTEHCCKYKINCNI
jgi:phage anti-repressor protein